MRRRRISTRALMILIAVVAVDAAIWLRAVRLDLGTAFSLFIGATLITLNLFFLTYLESADRINAAPPERQGEMLATLGCLVVVMMALTLPIIFVFLARGGI